MDPDFHATSPWFIRFFRHYTWLLFYRRFEHVWLNSAYHPSPDRSTVYFANHTSWWDGLIPFLLNEFHFRQEGRAIMEYKQMERYRFFRKIGAVPIDRDHPRSAMQVIRKSADFLNQPGRSLYIFPQGRMYSECDPIEFEGGLSRLVELTEAVDFVPLAITINTVRFDKPELYLASGEPAELPETFSHQERTIVMMKQLEQILRTTRKHSICGVEGFTQFL